MAKKEPTYEFLRLRAPRASTAQPLMIALRGIMIAVRFLRKIIKDALWMMNYDKWN